MKYEIMWCEVVKEGTGAKGAWKKSKMSLKDEAGKVEHDIITFLDVMPGGTLEGTIVDNAQYATREFKKGLEKPNFMKRDISKDVKAAQDRTTASVNKTLDRKEESIKLSAAQRDAVLIVTQLISSESLSSNPSDVKEEIVKWRNWFLLDETFNNPPPFND